jgi:hypothetical protein
MRLEKIKEDSIVEKRLVKQFRRFFLQILLGVLLQHIRQLKKE